MLSLLGTFTCFCLEVYINGWKKSALYRLLFKRSKSTVNDLFLSSLHFSGVDKLISTVLCFGSVGYVTSLFVDQVEWSLLDNVSSPFVQFFLYVVIYDFLAYWRHRASHKIDFWWELHKVHHSATELNVITGGRGHPAEIFLAETFLCIPIALLGAPVETYLAIKALLMFQGKLHHTDLHWNWGWLGKYIFLSPRAHRVHHSPYKEHWDKNFGHITPLWDRLFGTWYKGVFFNKEIDTDENIYNQNSVLNDFYVPYKRFIEKFWLRLSRKK